MLWTFKIASFRCWKKEHHCMDWNKKRHNQNKRNLCKTRKTEQIRESESCVLKNVEGRHFFVTCLEKKPIKKESTMEPFLINVTLRIWLVVEWPAWNHYFTPFSSRPHRDNFTASNQSYLVNTSSRSMPTACNRIGRLKLTTGGTVTSISGTPVAGLDRWKEGTVSLWDWVSPFSRFSVHGRSFHSAVEFACCASSVTWERTLVLKTQQVIWTTCCLKILSKIYGGMFLQLFREQGIL